jgi:hypothetical protein
MLASAETRFVTGTYVPVNGCAYMVRRGPDGIYGDVEDSPASLGGAASAPIASASASRTR